MRTLLVAVLAGVLGVGAMPLSAQQDKSAPEDHHLLLTRQHRFAMTHARRVEDAEASEKEDAVREVGSLGNAIEAALGELDEVAKAVGPAYAAQIEVIRNHELDAQKHWQLANAEGENGKLAVMKSHAAAAREAIDAAETAHQKMMAQLESAPKPEAAKPDTTKPTVIKQ
jgi:hypothetical protein